MKLRRVGRQANSMLFNERKQCYQLTGSLPQPPEPWSRDWWFRKRSPNRCRAKREQLERVQGLLPESQGQNLAVAV